MKTIYVGMGLTQAPKEFRNDFQHELKAGLRALKEVEIADFMGIDDGLAPLDIYEHDRNSAEGTDLCVFIADHPSIGMGMEIAYRQATEKPMIIFARDEIRITRMLLGMCEKENVAFVRYTTTQEIVDRVEEELLKLG